MNPLKQKRAFTLSELLIALALLGIIATLAISTISGTTNGGTKKALALQVASNFQSAFNEMERTTAANSATILIDFRNFIDYTKVLGNSVRIDSTPTSTDVSVFNCSGARCSSGSNVDALRMKNGAIVFIPNGHSLGTSGGNLRALPILIDPDGKESGVRDSAEFWLFIDGNLLSREHIPSGTVNSSGTYNPIASIDPDYLD